MNFSRKQIENLLKLPPRPRAPGDLKEKLIMQMQSSPRVSPQFAISPPGSWLRRWWPALVPAGLSLVCAVVFAVQQKEIRELKQAVQAWSANAPAENPSRRGAGSLESSAESLAKQQEEITQLRDTIGKLTADISRFEQTRLENQNLRAQLTARATSTFSPDELADMEKARERAMKSQCVNNMKQMGLAVRIWTLDNNDTFPPDIVCMSNELSTPKILVCPADTGRQKATNFSTYSDINCSYEYLGGTDTEPTRVMFRCPIHGNLGMCDGSVQAEVAKTHPEWLVQRNGKLYCEPPRQQ